MKHILIFRFSAMGDVAMTVPVIRAAVAQNSNLHFTIVTRPFFAPFFTDVPNCTLIFPDLKKKHKGFLGLMRLSSELNKKQNWSCILDLHNVLRTKVLCKFLGLRGIPSYVIDKGRAEKKNIVVTKDVSALKHTTDRYKKVFEEAGIMVGRFSKSTITSSIVDYENAMQWHDSISPKEGTCIGIAPFAAHDAKVWGVANTKQLIELISKSHSAYFLLFGGGKEESEALQKLAVPFDNVHVVAGNLKFSEEIALMKVLDFMISMDSSNMHIASLVGVKTLSIWGGTHPCFGFAPVGQPKEHTIQIEDGTLDCKPCSIFGNKPCIHDTKLCMDRVTPSIVLDRIHKLGYL